MMEIWKFLYLIVLSAVIALIVMVLLQIQSDVKEIRTTLNTIEFITLE